MLKAVIIDDEQHCIDDLLYLIEQQKLPLTVVGVARNASEGKEAISTFSPDVVFLDIIMPGTTGFDLLDELDDVKFNLIITTSVDKFAIQAIRASAIDFLVKPIRATELVQAIDRVMAKQEIPGRQQLSLLKEHLQTPAPLTRIAVNISEGIQLLKLDQILYFQSDGNYTHICMTNKKTMLVTRQLGKFEELLSGTSFFRVHASYLINLHHVDRFIRSDGGYVVMENGETISVARTRKEELLSQLARI